MEQVKMWASELSTEAQAAGFVMEARTLLAWQLLQGLMQGGSNAILDSSVDAITSEIFKLADTFVEKALERGGIRATPPADKIVERIGAMQAKQQIAHHNSLEAANATKQ